MCLRRLKRKGKVCRTGEEGKADHVIPLQVLAEHELRKDDKHDQRDDFLEDFELIAIENAKADPVGGNLKAVFKKGDAPGNQDRKPKWTVLKIFEMAVPGVGHERIGSGKKENRLKDS